MYKRQEDYTITQPGTCHASDYVENIEDATKTKVGFLSFEKREDLHQMSDDEVKEDAKSGYEEQSFTEEMIFEEEKEITEEGIYDVKLAVKDEAGNMKAVYKRQEQISCLPKKTLGIIGGAAVAVIVLLVLILSLIHI